VLGGVDWTMVGPKRDGLRRSKEEGMEVVEEVYDRNGGGGAGGLWTDSGGGDRGDLEGGRSILVGLEPQLDPDLSLLMEAFVGESSAERRRDQGFIVLVETTASLFPDLSKAREVGRQDLRRGRCDALASLLISSPLLPLDDLVVPLC
jgi:hypothetical protein